MLIQAAIFGKKYSNITTINNIISLTYVIHQKSFSFADLLLQKHLL